MMTTTISSSPFFRTQIETQPHTQKCSLSLSLSLSRETKGKKRGKRAKIKKNRERERERERSIFFQQMEEDFVSLSFSSSSSYSSERYQREKKERSVLLASSVSRRASLSLSLDARARARGGFKKIYTIDPSRFLPQTLLLLWLSGENISKGERETRKKEKQKQTLFFTLTQTDCLLADVALTAALLSGIKPEADKVQAIFY